MQTSPSWWVKIGDFGISKRVSNNDTALQTATGTPHYLAPEVYHYVSDDDEDEESDTYTDAVDIWSFACVVYEMMALRVPFPIYPRSLVAFCRGGPFPEGPLNGRTSREGIEFIKTLLVPLPRLRPPAKDAIKAPWLSVEASKYTTLLTKKNGNSIVLLQPTDDEQSTTIVPLDRLRGANVSTIQGPANTNLNRTPSRSVEVDSLPTMNPFRRLVSENAASTILVNHSPSSQGNTPIHRPRMPPQEQFKEHSEKKRPNHNERPTKLSAKGARIPNIRLSFITAQHQAKFEQLFKGAVGDDGQTLSGGKVRDLLLRSRLDGNTLSQIWYVFESPLARMIVECGLGNDGIGTSR